MRTQPRLSDSERAERRERDREHLKQAAEQLLTSEGWQRWVRIRAQGGLARLSLNNQLLVALSCPDATFVAGFRAWLKLGYCVRKGEKAIRIVAPMPIKQRETETAAGDDETRVLFKGVAVFDRSQVAAIDGMPQAPLEPPSKPLTGDSHANLLEPTRAFAESLGFSVSFESIPGAIGGWCDQKARRIVVDAAQPANAQLRILIHETIHGLGIGYAEYGRARAEVIVDTTTLIVLGAVGLDTAGETIRYVAGWGEGGALEAVTEFANLIDTLARRIEAALDPSEVIESSSSESRLGGGGAAVLA
jgi:hypothetical protein